MAKKSRAMTDEPSVPVEIIEAESHPAGFAMRDELRVNARRSLDDLARAHGQLARPAPDGDRYTAAHMCAAALHGWNWHVHHYGPVELSDADYLAALEAARNGRAHTPANRRPSR